MNRQPLLDLLADYQKIWPTEANVASQISQLVHEHENCFDRTCMPGHVTGSAWVLSHDGSKHLLLHHRKLKKWLQPGGHADGQVEIDQVALREVEEESGLSALEISGACSPQGLLDIDVHLIPARHQPDGSLLEPEHEHHDLRYLVQCTEEQELVVSEESHEVRWFTAKEVRQQTKEISVLRLLDKTEALLAATNSK